MTVSAYRLYTVMPKLVKFVDQLTNWYVRMNRKRLKVCLSNPLITSNNLSADDIFICFASLRNKLRHDIPCVSSADTWNVTMINP